MQPVGDRDHFIGGVERAGADQNGAIKRTKHAIDAVARITEHFFDAPRMEPLDKKIANGLGHSQNLDGTRFRVPTMRLQE